ncbi:MAG: hypothetical protein KKE73_14910 [Proteobacteria bacterium]|nr:hypothetical protein [Pseudomonadota bacterium]
MKSMYKKIAVAFCLAALMGLAGCGPKDNRITLDYTAVGSAVPCAQTVGVAPIVDLRTDKMLGHNESVAFRPDGRGVDQWVQEALIAEFTASGCQAGAVQGQELPRYVVDGEVHAARLVTEGMDHALDLDLRLTLLEGERVVLKKTYVGHWEQMIFPASRAKSEALFDSSLSELLGTAVSDFITAMQP